MDFDQLDALAAVLAAGTTKFLAHLTFQQRLYVALAACDGKCLDVAAAACALRRLDTWERRALELRHPNVITLLEQSGECEEDIGLWRRMMDNLITARLWTMLQENPQWSFELIGSAAHKEAKRPTTTLKLLAKQLIGFVLRRRRQPSTTTTGAEAPEIH